MFGYEVAARLGAGLPARRLAHQNRQAPLLGAVAAGALPGVLRTHILATDPTAREQTLTLVDLARAQAIYLGNSLRGLRRVTRLDTTERSGAPSSPQQG